MRLKTLIPAATAVALGIVGMAQQQQQNPQPQQTQPGTAQNQAMRTPTDVMTLAMHALSMSNYFEIASSQAALNKGVSDNVRQFAQRMITDHTRNQQQLQQLAQRMNITLPADEGVANRLRIIHASALSGREFERAYLQAQVDGHESTALFLETALRMMDQGAQGNTGNQNTTGSSGSQAGSGSAGTGTDNQTGQGGSTGGQTGQGTGGTAQTGQGNAQDMAQARQFMQTTLATVRQHLQQATQLYRSVSQ